MEWQQIIIVALLVLGSLATISNVGKSRQPLTGGVAAASTAINGVVIVLILSL